MRMILFRMIPPPDCRPFRHHEREFTAARCHSGLNPDAQRIWPLPKKQTSRYFHAARTASSKDLQRISAEENPALERR